MNKIFAGFLGIAMAFAFASCNNNATEEAVDTTPVCETECCEHACQHECNCEDTLCAQNNCQDCANDNCCKKSEGCCEGHACEHEHACCEHAN